MNNQTSLRGAKATKQSIAFGLWIASLTLAMTIIIAFPALAEDHVFSPDGCEFQITFPGEPYTTQRCDPDHPDKCNKITSFTEVFGLDATVSFNVTCYPVSAAMYDRYSGEVMKATLAAMAASNKLAHIETHFGEQDGAKQAVLLGAGHSGNSEMLYSTHLWIGHKSLLTAEAELIGDQPPEAATEMFTAILKSIAPVKANSEADADKKENKNENKQPEEPKTDDDDAKQPAP